MTQGEGDTAAHPNRPRVAPEAGGRAGCLVCVHCPRQGDLQDPSSWGLLSRLGPVPTEAKTGP